MENEQIIARAKLLFASDYANGMIPPEMLGISGHFIPSDKIDFDTLPDEIKLKYIEKATAEIEGDNVENKPQSAKLFIGLLQPNGKMIPLMIIGSSKGDLTIEG